MNSEISSQWRAFLHDYYFLNKPSWDICWDINEDIQSAVLRGAKRITIDFNALEKFDLDNGTNLIKTLLSNNGLNLKETLIDFESAIKEFDRVKESQINPELEDTKLKLGLKNLPHSYKLGELADKKFLEKLIQTEGLISNIGVPFLVSLQKTFVCERCEYRKVESYSPFGRRVKNQMFCPSCRNIRMFNEIKDEEIVASFQLLTIVEETSTTTPISLTLLLPEDLIDNPDPEKRKFLAGNKIKVVGILTDRTIKGLNIKKPYLDTFYWEIESEEIILSPEDEKEIKKFAQEEKLIDKLVSAFCPSIYGYEKIKEALILQAVGGVTKISPLDKKLKRGNIHILLIGDPSTGKTSLGIFNFKYIPKCKYAVCSELTSAGLGVAMLKDKETETWYISSGILPLAHKSIAILDEIDKATPDDIKSLDVVMELQLLPVDKAGISMKLPAETTILAIANPKHSRFDPYIDLKEQVTLSEVTLSRFDLKYCFRDIADEEQDSKVADRIFRKEDLETEISPEFLTKYILYAKKLAPKLADESFSILKDFYVDLRGRTKEKGGILQITPRQLEGLIRLTEAYAKLRLAEETNGEDSKKAIELFKSYLRTFGFSPETGELDIDKAEGRVSKERRSEYWAINEKFEELVKLMKNVPEEDFIEECMKDGIEKRRVLEFLELGKREGKIFEPKPRIYSSVEVW